MIRRLLRLLGWLVIAADLVWVTLLGGVLIDLPTWNFRFRAVAPAAGLWYFAWPYPILAGLGIPISAYLVRDPRNWRIAIRAVAIGYFVACLIGNLWFGTFLGVPDEQFWGGWFTQMWLAAAPCWGSAIAAVLVTFTPVRREMSVAVIVLNYLFLLFIVEAIWTPNVIPFLSKLS